jgi:pullulanase/glycogen debranching enzyme
LTGCEEREAKQSVDFVTHHDGFITNDPWSLETSGGRKNPPCSP